MNLEVHACLFHFPQGIFLVILHKQFNLFMLQFAVFWETEKFLYLWENPNIWSKPQWTQLDNLLLFPVVLKQALNQTITLCSGFFLCHLWNQQFAGSTLPAVRLSLFYIIIYWSVSACINWYIKLLMKKIPWPESNLRCLVQIRMYVFDLCCSWLNIITSYYHSSAAVKSQVKSMFLCML